MLATSPSLQSNLFRFRVFRRLVILTSILALTNCTQIPTKQTSTLTKEQQHYLNTQNQLRTNIKTWALVGKTSTQIKPKKRVIALVNWQQQAKQIYQVIIQGPLGAGRIQLSSETNPNTGEHQVRLTTQKNELITTTPQQTLHQETGLNLPINALAWWLKGLPEPSVIHTITKSQPSGLTERFSQHNWTIRYAEFTQVQTPEGTPVFLPKKVYLDGQKAGNTVSMKWVITQWDVSFTDPI